MPESPPPWRDKLQLEDDSPVKPHNRGESMLWLASSHLEHEATIQEGVKEYHLSVEHSHQFFVGGAQCKGPFARQVHGCDNCEGI